jgi:hypothetical protein
MQQQQQQQHDQHYPRPDAHIFLTRRIFLPRLAPPNYLRLEDI